jgi:hypothetical protein
LLLHANFYLMPHYQKQQPPPRPRTDCRVPPGCQPALPVTCDFSAANFTYALGVRCTACAEGYFLNELTSACESMGKCQTPLPSSPSPKRSWSAASTVRRFLFYHYQSFLFFGGKNVSTNQKSASCESVNLPKVMTPIRAECSTCGPQGVVQSQCTATNDSTCLCPMSKTGPTCQTGNASAGKLVVTD